MDNLATFNAIGFFLIKGGSIDVSISAFSADGEHITTTHQYNPAYLTSNKRKPVTGVFGMMIDPIIPPTSNVAFLGHTQGDDLFAREAGLDDAIIDAAFGLMDRLGYKFNADHWVKVKA
jgi:hypothetical protein